MTDKKSGAEKREASEPVEAKEATAVEAGTSRRRPVRITRDLLVNKGPLHIPDQYRKPGMHYFWMKDGPYAFEKYASFGYDFALDDAGNKISKGRAGEKMYLLDIPQDLYDELHAMKVSIKKERTAEVKEIKAGNLPNYNEGLRETIVSSK